MGEIERPRSSNNKAEAELPTLSTYLVSLGPALQRSVMSSRRIALVAKVRMILFHGRIYRRHMASPLSYRDDGSGHGDGWYKAK